MKSESIIKGVSIGISTAILWSIVLNSKVVGIGVGICLGISLAISDTSLGRYIPICLRRAFPMLSWKSCEVP